MSQVKFIGCLHSGHTFMATHRGFSNSYEHDEHLIKQYNSIVNKKDLVYILGDITMEKNSEYYQLDRLNGRKIVVLGNHDLPRHVRSLLNYVEEVAGMVDYKGFCLTHAPIHPSEIGFYRGNIHAHIHENILSECIVPNLYKDYESIELPTLHKYFNVDAHKINYTPLSIEELTK